jgi:hypothetical protein
VKLQTVNVVESVDSTLSAIHSFSEDEEGNKEAEALFTKIAKENGFDDEDVEFGLEEGELTLDDTNYALFIIHS